MSKIICDLCGTVYPDTEECCPTCGTDKPVTAQYMSEPDGAYAPHREYTHTPGGRFSNSNVKKRLKNKGVAPAPVPQKPAKSGRPAQQPRKEQPVKEQPRSENRQPERPRQESSGSNKGLVITAIILVIAIIAMLVYIYVTFLMPPAAKPEDSTPPAPQQTQDTTPPTTTAPDLSCKGLTLSQTTVRFEEAGSSVLLNVTADPVDTVDALTFVSADPNVATVSAEGLVTAVAKGQTVITVTCGSQTTQCQVVCDIPEETTVPETTVPETTVPTIVLKLNREDITFSSKGEAWPLYNGEIPMNEITWSVGNESVATVKNGTVRAVGPGTTNVYAEYQGQKVSCIIRCNFD